ncbi:MAG: TolC family protein [Bacteroidota bacterium]
MNKNTLLIMFLFLLNFFTQAQELTLRTISLQEALNLALKNAKSIQISNYKIENATAKKDMAVNAFLPQVAVNASYSRLSTNIEPFKITIPGIITTELNPVIPNQYANRASIQQNVFSGMRNIYNLQASKDMIYASQLDAKKEEEDILMNTILQYYTYCKTTESAKLLRENLKTVDARIKDIQNFQTVGMALPNDVLKAELSKSNLEITQAEIDNTAAIINYNINLLLGINEQTQLSPSPIDIDATPTNAFTFNPTYDNRLDWKSFNLKILAGQKQVKSAQSAYFPTVNAGFNFYYNNPNQRVFPQTAKFKETWDAGISLNWNLSSLYTARASIRDAKINTKINDLLLGQIQDGIRSEQYSALKNYELSLQKIKMAEKTVEQAKENQRIMQNRFASSVAVFTDLLEADTQLLQAQINLVNAQYDAKITYYKYIKASGNLATSIIN